MSMRLIAVIKVILLTAQLLLGNSLYGKSLDLGKADWKLNSATFNLGKVIDGRKTPGPAGKVTGVKPAELTIDPDLERGIAQYLTDCIESDTSTTVELDFVIDRFKITDAISGIKHTVTMDFNFKLIREIDGEKTTIYESAIKPVITGMGSEVPAGFYENPVKNAIKRFFEAFDHWSQKNSKNPFFMNHVAVGFKDDPKWADRTVGDTVLWSGSYKLAWSDFKGKDSGNSPFSAQSNCVYTLKTEPEYHTDTLYVRESIQPIFTRGASWVHDDALQDTLLMHEQLHFDICELYARKFRMELSKMRLGLVSFDKQINELFAKTVNEYRNRQSLYDTETEHGIISEKQVSWMKSIREELDALAVWQTGKP